METSSKRDVKLYCGPMSLNIVDSIIAYAAEFKTSIGLIASRRQIDLMGGYVNNWTTKNFVEYVRNKTDRVVLCRDHGGPGQGNEEDDGIESLLHDIELMDIVHIDPWKKLSFKESLKYTVDIIERGYFINPDCLYEVGTEQAIYEMNPFVFEYFLKELKTKLKTQFDNIVYGVIQSGTSLKDGKNTGVYSKEALNEMTGTCKRLGILSKEHNGDYLTSYLIREKFDHGLNAINIAPELANIESNIVLKNISGRQFNKWFDLTTQDKRWKKWFNKDFDPNKNKCLVLELCGHYVYSHSEFKKVIDLEEYKSKVMDGIFNYIGAILNEKG